MVVLMMMTVMVVVMVVCPGGEYWACKHQQQQCRCENPFHEKHPSMP